MVRTRLLLSRLGQPGSIPALVLPSGGMAARHRKGATAERFIFIYLEMLLCFNPGCAEALKSVAAASITSGVELREDANATAIKRYINSHNSVSSSTGVSTSELDSVLKDLERRVSVSESLFRLDPLSPCSLIVWSALLPLFYPESPFGECAHCSHIILPTEAVSFHEELARFFEMVDSLLRSEQILRLFKDDLKTLWSSAPSIAQPNSCTSRPETKACAPKQGSAKPMAKTSQQKAVYSIKQPPANDSATKSVPDLLDDGSSLPTTLPVTEDDLHQATACFKPLGSFKRPVYPVPKLPQSKSSGVRNILITSALPYVNNVPHLGNMIGSTLSASVFALYCDVAGYNVLSICGTDEYGTATEAKALSEHMTPRQICDKYHKLHCDIYSWFDIQFDYFGRTTTDKHQEIVQDLFQKLWENQYITEDTLEQLFCENCSKFLADRFVEGTCPFCKYDDARGDQCDKCGRLMNAIELKQPRCKTCQHSPVVRSSKHLFLDLPKIESKLAAFVEQRAYNPTSLWTTNARTISSTWIRDGLRPRCITRDLNWGVPVPLEEYKNKVFYVWFDAPIGYLSITANYTPEWRHWWQPTPKQISEMGPIELFQFMAKDNVPFHAIIFPACLLAANAGHTLVQHLLSTAAVPPGGSMGAGILPGRPGLDRGSRVAEVGFEPRTLRSVNSRSNHLSHLATQIYRQLQSSKYMNYEGTKFSKSRGIGVFGDGAMSSGIHSNVWRFYLLYRRPETQVSKYMNYEGTKFSKSRGIGVFGDGAMSSGIHSNVWRFYLLYRRPETQDSAFVWDDFMLVTNCELLNNLGNFINRALAFVARFFNGKIPNMDGLDPSDVEFLAQVAQLIRSYAMHMEAGRLREGLRQILAISRLGNVYFQVNQPWVAIKKEETKPRAGVVIGVAANVACLLGMLLYPFMPTIGRQIWTEQCNLSTDVLSLLSLSRQDYRLAQLLPAGHQIGRPTPLFRKMEPEDINKLSKLYGSGMTASSDSPSGESCSNRPHSVITPLWCLAPMLPEGSIRPEILSDCPSLDRSCPDAEKYTHLQLNLVFTHESTEPLVYDVLQLNVLHTGRLMIQLARYSRNRSIFSSRKLLTRLLKTPRQPTTGFALLGAHQKLGLEWSFGTHDASSSSSTTPVFNTNASLLYNHDLFESLILKKRTFTQAIWIESDNKNATDIGWQPYLVVSPTRHSENQAVPILEGE
ncbi:hypothetical protein T265_07791 [Opisthorchis viverrini]|uniref:Methionine--tRNA ligase, cytoplasmic n=1 Tax=Opisthorchis viverrini TaxID=6198 RepID=A0A074ZML4_OPIVI|nr:hypothetical protein T265_07791 [Opisthorchis viverrini]KER24600.1 hypothetical protein T265_07791 [Opisthorchis viverrini]